MDVWCICLKSRNDKYEYVKKELEKTGLDVKFYRPEKEESGMVGCFNSHLHCMKNSTRHCLVFEDDVMFDSVDFSDIMTFLKSDIEWDIIRLGAQNVAFYYRALNNVYRGKSYNAHAIIYNKELCKKMEFHNSHIDDYFYNNDFKDFTLLDPLCRQKHFSSDNSWFGTFGIQRCMQSKHVYERLQYISNKLAKYLRWLPIRLQKCLNLWCILISIGLYLDYRSE
jgi:hypothetical protein